MKNNDINKLFSLTFMHQHNNGCDGRPTTRWAHPSTPDQMLTTSFSVLASGGLHFDAHRLTRRRVWALRLLWSVSNDSGHRHCHMYMATFSTKSYHKSRFDRLPSEDHRKGS